MLLVIEKLLENDDLISFRNRLICADWIDGAQTAGSRSIAVKNNLQLDLKSPLARDLGHEILRKLGLNPLFVSATLAENIFPPIFNMYQDGGCYGTHTDAALMRLPDSGATLRSDISATIFLSNPEDYDGGELVIEDQFGAQAVKLSAGDMILYPSSSLHQVTPVTRGQRICAITWMQSAVADSSARSLLFDLDQAIQALSPAHTANDPHINQLVNTYHNLLRRWAKP